MLSFIEQLNSLSKNSSISAGGEQYAIGSLIKKANAIRKQHPQLKQSHLALRYTTLADFITALLAFDGWCASVYLCPPQGLLPQQELLDWPADTPSRLIKSQSKIETQDRISSHWFLATSGTTGNPKWYSHTFNSLTASTKYSEKLQSLSWGLLYQPFRFAGLQVVLQALLNGADLVDATADEPLNQMAKLKHAKVTALSATPSMWRQLFMTGQLGELNLTHITLGGEIADQTILDSLQSVFPTAKLRHIYASTETGVGLVVTDGMAGFPKSWLEDKTLAVSLKISEQQHLLVKPNHPVCDTLSLQTDSQGYVDTLDKVAIQADRVQFIGRATGTINVGGNKVHPEKVEQVILQCAQVNQVRVYPKKSAMLGELVMAEVTVLKDLEPQKVKQQVLALCKKQLQRFEIPFKINIVSKIAQNPSGKLNRKLNRDPSA